MSSELSDALNPHIVHSRTRTSSSALYTPPIPAVQHRQQYVSDLQLAISEPVPPPPPPASPERTPARGRNAIQAILHVLQASHEAQESERKRRLAWEQEHEEKLLQRQAELERQMNDMRQEITEIRSFASMRQQDFDPMFGAVQVLPSQIPPGARPQNTPEHDEIDPRHPSPTFRLQYGRDGLSGSPQPSSDSPRPSVSSRRSSFDSDSRPLKRTNHHDTRCFTIQHAMRTHLLLLMGLTKDSDLPPSYCEGSPLGPQDPVRFIWTKTTNQSVHNAHMKARVLSDIQTRRTDLYTLVPARDWNKRALEAAFDQAFVTLRQRFKAQEQRAQDSRTENVSQAELSKTVKVRRLSRKRTVMPCILGDDACRNFLLQKLNNRADARNTMAAFGHLAFDGAFQLDCLSSEESDQEQSSSRSPNSRSTKLTVHPLPWRSKRLVAFFAMLDARHDVHIKDLPKRGVGRRARVDGQPRDAGRMPPRGVQRWMISKKWWRETEVEVKDLETVLDKSGPGEDELDLGALGLADESEDEVDGDEIEDMERCLHSGGLLVMGNEDQQGHTFVHGHFGTHFGTCNPTLSSLHNALAPV
jgi:hypothetical protein